MTSENGGDILTAKGRMKMATQRKFTPKEIKVFEANPYTYRVTENRISFTLEAKEKMLELLASKSPRQTMKAMGYDPDVLGAQRIRSLVKHLREEAKSNAGLHQGYKKRVVRKPLTTDEIAELGTDEESYARLKNEVVYLRAEVEFLKKISQQAISGKRGK